VHTTVTKIVTLSNFLNFVYLFFSVDKDIHFASCRLAYYTIESVLHTGV